MKKILYSVIILLLNFSNGISMAVNNITENFPANSEAAIFAMGCFWCGDAAFKDEHTNQPYDGILSIRIGYTGGASKNPTYGSHAGHKEAIKVVFDPSKISYEKLLDIFWRNIDPLNPKGQFCDIGSSYTTVIFYLNEGQRVTAEKSKRETEAKLGAPVATEVFIASEFYDGEEYHQNYKSKNPTRYKNYLQNCGRDERLKEINELLK